MNKPSLREQVEAIPVSRDRTLSDILRPDELDAIVELVEGRERAAVAAHQAVHLCQPLRNIYIPPQLTPTKDKDTTDKESNSEQYGP